MKVGFRLREKVEDSNEQKESKNDKQPAISFFSFFFSFLLSLSPSPSYLLRNCAQLRVAERRLGQRHGGRGLDAVGGVVGYGDDVGEGRGRSGRVSSGAGAAGAAVAAAAASLEQAAALAERASLGVGDCFQRGNWRGGGRGSFEKEREGREERGERASARGGTAKAARLFFFSLSFLFFGISPLNVTHRWRRRKAPGRRGASPRGRSARSGALFLGKRGGGFFGRKTERRNSTTGGRRS